MKLDDLAQEFETDHNITDDQLQLAFDKLEEANPAFNTALSLSEVRDLAQELSEDPDFGRNKGSAEFILNRLHVLVNGLAPSGISEHRAETMFRPSNNMKKFAEENNIDVEEQIDHARAELKTRPKPRKEDEAKEMFLNYWRENKDMFPRFNQYDKADIIRDLMFGTDPEDAFTPYVV